MITEPQTLTPRYIEGYPKQYQFDTQKGWFACIEPDRWHWSRTLSFQPLAWRIYVDQNKDRAELFFIDQTNCLSVIQFEGYSLDNLFRLMEPLYYEDQTLSDVVITVKAERYCADRRVDRQLGIYMASFTHLPADPVRPVELQHYADTQCIYDHQTRTDTARVKTAHGYCMPCVVEKTNEVRV